jgi:hypothetical protein
MDLHYGWLSLFFLLVAALVIWLIKQNRKDQRAYEKENRSKVNPEDKSHSSPDAGE